VGGHRLASARPVVSTSGVQPSSTQLSRSIQSSITPEPNLANADRVLFSGSSEVWAC
jgi:hypothetical protein